MKKPLTDFTIAMDICNNKYTVLLNPPPVELTEEEKAKEVELKPLVDEYNYKASEARRTLACVVERSGWNNEQLPIWKFHKAMEDSIIARLKLELAKEKQNG
jgi:hypothetical protein